MAKNEIKYGALLSYILIIINALYGLIVSPYILQCVGADEYGVYKTISSFTSAFMVLDLGLGLTMMRYIAKFRADGQEHKIPNYISMCFIQAGIILVVLSVAMLFMYFSVDNIFSKGLSVSEIEKAKQLYAFLALSLLMHIIENVFNGIITGYNHFVLGNGIKLLRLVSRIILIFLLLSIVKDTLLLVIIDLLLTFMVIIIEAVYIFYRLHVKVRFVCFEKSLFIDSLKYTSLMFITSITSQIENNLDNIVIGAIIGAVAVAIYSYGLLIFGMFQQLSTAIASVLLPTVTNILAVDDENKSNTQKLVVKIGRVQFSLLGAAAVGFLIIGKRFISFWLGKGYEDVYYIVLILIFPAILELCVNTCLTVLRAQNKIGFRTIVLLSTTVLNAIITVIGTYFWNYYAAAIGTAVSFFLGSVVIMNIYYYRKIGFNMISIYLSIFKRIWVCILLSGLTCAVVAYFVKSQILGLILPIMAFVITYAITLLLFGLNKEEKETLLKVRNKK